MRIAQQNLYSLFSTQVFLVRSFNSQFSYIISADVVSLFILADSTPLNIETGKLEQFLLEDTALLRREL